VISLSLTPGIYFSAEVPLGSFCFSIKVCLNHSGKSFEDTNNFVANLLPRKGRDKPGCEGEDRLRGVAGEAGMYGCLAVDNLYNIMHTTDRMYSVSLPSTDPHCLD